MRSKKDLGECGIKVKKRGANFLGCMGSSSLNQVEMMESKGLVNNLTVFSCDNANSKGDV